MKNYLSPFEVEIQTVDVDLYNECYVVHWVGDDLIDWCVLHVS